MIAITVEVERAGRRTEQVVQLPEGTLVRAAVRAAGHASEGCAVLIGGISVPRDLPLLTDTRLTLIPTFSGG